jgi:hypothetical protein
MICLCGRFSLNTKALAHQLEDEGGKLRVEEYLIALMLDIARGGERQ